VKDASLKRLHHLRGVVIDKKLFSRAIKDKSAKAEEKPLIEKT
jgi:DNA-directed RNA polymerase subunit beta